MARPISVSRPTTTDGELNPGVITPPDKHSLPLTPPASTERHAPLTGIEGVLEILDDCRIRFCVPKSPIKLRSQAYDQLITVLRDHQVLGRYTQDKLRFDYDPRSELLCIRMPAPVHDALATFVANEIHESVRAIRHLSNSAGDFATHIVNVGSSRIWLREEAAEGDEPRPPRLQRQPDAQFQHRKATYPGVVLEVSYSQDGKDLKKLAWDYIQCSDGDIKVVIGIDINYGSAASTVSLWRPKYIWEEGEELLDVEPEIDSQPFRSPTGEPLNQARCIQLKLEDFATDELCAGLESAVFSISFEKLAKLLDEAEDLQKTREGGPSEGTNPRRRIKRKKRISSSPDRLGSDDEALFREEEARISRRDDIDPDFEPPVRRKRG